MAVPSDVSICVLRGHMESERILLIPNARRQVICPCERRPTGGSTPVTAGLSGRALRPPPGSSSGGLWSVGEHGAGGLKVTCGGALCGGSWWVQPHVPWWHPCEAVEGTLLELRREVCHQRRVSMAHSPRGELRSWQMWKASECVSVLCCYGTPTVGALRSKCCRCSSCRSDSGGTVATENCIPGWTAALAKRASVTLMMRPGALWCGGGDGVCLRGTRGVPGVSPGHRSGRLPQTWRREMPSPCGSLSQKGDSEKSHYFLRPRCPL